MKLLAVPAGGLGTDAGRLAETTGVNGAVLPGPGQCAGDGHAGEGGQAGRTAGEAVALAAVDADPVPFGHRIFEEHCGGWDIRDHRHVGAGRGRIALCVGDGHGDRVRALQCGERERVGRLRGQNLAVLRELPRQGVGRRGAEIGGRDQPGIAPDAVVVAGDAPRGGHHDELELLHAGDVDVDRHGRGPVRHDRRLVQQAAIPVNLEDHRRCGRSRAVHADGAVESRILAVERDRGRRIRGDAQPFGFVRPAEDDRLSCCSG